MIVTKNEREQNTTPIDVYKKSTSSPDMMGQKWGWGDKSTPVYVAYCKRTIV